MLDLYGRELAVGDRVIYSGYYRSSSVREGRVIAIHDNGRISVRCYLASGGPVSRNKYYDERNGKWIDPYFHRKVEAGYHHKETGEKISWDNLSATKTIRTDRGWTSVPNPDFVPEDMREYKSDEYADYVKFVTLPGGNVSTFRCSNGIVKIPMEDK